VKELSYAAKILQIDQSLNQSWKPWYFMTWDFVYIMLGSVFCISSQDIIWNWLQKFKGHEWCTIWWINEGFLT